MNIFVEIAKRQNERGERIDRALSKTRKKYGLEGLQPSFLLRF